VGLALLAFGGARLGCHRLYYAELETVRALLEALPGVEIVELGGNEDVTLEDIYAQIRIDGQDVVELYDLTAESFAPGRHLNVGSAGGLAPRGSCCCFQNTWMDGEPKPRRERSLAWGIAVDVGPGGYLAPELAGGIASVQDLVARRREVAKLLASWPRCPDAKRYTDAEGSPHLLCAVEGNGGNYSIYPPLACGDRTDRCPPPAAEGEKPTVVAEGPEC
jgi:hypothetical protein